MSKTLRTLIYYVITYIIRSREINASSQTKFVWIICVSVYLIKQKSVNKEVALIEKIAENTWKIHGSAFMDDVSEIIGVHLTNDEYDTFNGFVFHTLESIPKDGTDIEFEIQNLRIKVTEVIDHQVETAIISKQAVPEKTIEE